jgi:magnesium chelatase accessory protein
MTTTTRYLDTSFGRLAYVDVGPAREAAPDRTPLVFLHGWAGAKSLWLTALPFLAEDFRCVALDLPNHGESSAAPGIYDAPGLATLIAPALRTLGVAPAILVGHSLGCLVGLYLTLEHPDTVSGLVLSNPPHPERGVWSGRLVLNRRHEAATLQAVRAVNALAARVAAPDSGGPPSGTVRRWQAAAQVSVPAMQGTLRTNFAQDLAPRLPSIQVPTLVLAGAFDVTTLPSGARSVAERIPGSTLYVYPRAAHHPMDSAAADFAARVGRWAAERTSLPATPFAERD